MYEIAEIGRSYANISSLSVQLPSSLDSLYFASNEEQRIAIAHARQLIREISMY